jgi:uncharacterized RDD family membrane protein YckC
MSAVFRPCYSGGDRGRSDSRSNLAAVTDAVEDTVPSFAKRFGALFVDWLLCLLVSGLFVADLRTATWEPLAVLVVEYALFIGLFTQTPGMRIAKIRCVDAPGGGAIGIPRAMLRGLLLCLVIPALIMDKERRGLHDKAARSVIIPA